MVECMQENSWIQNLKAGHIVAVATYRNGYTHMVTKTVKKVTPGGKVRLENDMLFDIEGREVNGDAWATHAYLKTIAEFEEWKEENAARHHKKDLISQIEKLSLKGMSVEQLENILKIAKEA
jgi:hypothetical protein